MKLTCDEKIGSSTLLLETGRVSVDRSELVSVDGATFVDGLSDDVDNAAESLRADGHHNGGLHVFDGLTTNQAFGRVKGNCAHVVATKMLGNFEDESVAGAFDLKGIQNRRQFTFKLHVDDGTNDLGNLSSRLNGGAEVTYF